MLQTGTTNTTPAITTTSLKQAICFRTPKAGNISKIHGKWGNVTGTNTATFSMQDVNTSGQPDNTDDQTGVSVVPVANSFFTADFSSAQRTVAINEPVAFVIGASAIGTSFQIIQNNISVEENSCWPSTYNGSAWSNGGGTMPIAVEYSDGSIIPITGVIPGTRIAISYSTSSAPNELGNRFRLPFPCRIAGIVGYTSSGAAGVFNVKLYSDAMSQLATGTRGNMRGAGGPMTVMFTTPYEITANTWYRASILPTSTTNVTLGYYDAANTTQMAASPGGADYYYWSRTGAGAPTDTDTRRLMFSLVIDQFDSGGGGSLGTRARIVNGS